MKSHFRFYATLLGFVVAVFAAYRMRELWLVPADAAWTPAHLAVPLEVTGERFEVLVNGVPVTKAVADRHVMVAKDGGFVPLAQSDITARVNDTDRLRMARVPAMLWFAGITGGALVLFVVGLFTPMIGAFRPHGLVDLHLTT